jgi:hypothetical protein
MPNPNPTYTYLHARSTKSNLRAHILIFLQIYNVYNVFNFQKQRSWTCSNLQPTLCRAYVAHGCSFYSTGTQYCQGARSCTKGYFPTSSCPGPNWYWRTRISLLLWHAGRKGRYLQHRGLNNFLIRRCWNTCVHLMWTQVPEPTRMPSTPLYFVTCWSIDSAITIISVILQHPRIGRWSRLQLISWVLDLSLNWVQGYLTLLNFQDYKHLKNWPALIKRTRDDLHAQTPRALYNSQDGNSACFRVLSEYTKSLNIAPVLHNFAAAVFNLSLLLEVYFTCNRECPFLMVFD